MKKNFVISRIEASQDSNPYIIVAFTDPNESKSAGGGGGGPPQNPFGIGIGAVPFTSPEDLMKNLPKTMSNIFGGRGMSGDSPTFKITMKEYENMAIKVGDRVEIEIVKADDSSGI
jgi:hypothetical protein